MAASRDVFAVLLQTVVLAGVRARDGGHEAAANDGRAEIDAATPSPSFCDDEGDWKMTWQDNFDGRTLNRSIWTVPVGIGNGFGRAANVTQDNTYVEDGMLVLRSHQTGPSNWTTGAAITHDRKPGGTAVGASWKYGRFCIKAKLPGNGPGKSQGLWPAHWMMPSEYNEHCGYNEIDILEMINGDTTAWGTYWYWGPNGGGAPGQKPCNGAPVRAGEGHVDVPTYYTAFHEYAIEWTPTSLTYLVDGKPYKTYTNLTQLPVNPHYMMLNTAVGGPWPGLPNASTIFPAYHYIDYVRVSQKPSY